MKDVFLCFIYACLNQPPSSTHSSDPPLAVGLSPARLSSAPDLPVMEVKVRQTSTVNQA